MKTGTEIKDLHPAEEAVGSPRTRAGAVVVATLVLVATILAVLVLGSGTEDSPAAPQAPAPAVTTGYDGAPAD